MSKDIQPPKVNRPILQQLITGLSDGIVLIDPDGSIIWANQAALDMHRVTALADLGETILGYRRAFTLRYRNNHRLEEGQYPIERLIAGEAIDDVTIEISPQAEPDLVWVHTVRSLVLADAGDKPDVLVLIIKDETARFEAEERFESAFNANPAPGLISRLADHRFIRVNHHITPTLLVKSFQALRKQAASGVDGVTWYDYEKTLEGRVHELHREIQSGAYRVQPSRRV